MIFAKWDVDLADHPKVLGLGDDYFAGLGLWSVALAYCRRLQTDGLFPAAAPFLARNGAKRLARKLIAVGLWSERGDGFELLNYAAKNDTKAAIDARLEADRERKRLKKVQVDSVRNPNGIHEESNGNPHGFPGSRSRSETTSFGSSADSEAATGARAFSPAAPWTSTRFKLLFQEITGNTGAIHDDVANDGAAAAQRSAAASKQSVEERARAVITAFVDLEAIYRDGALLGHKGPSRCAASLVRGADGRWWNESEQWTSGWRPAPAVTASVKNPIDVRHGQLPIYSSGSTRSPHNGTLLDINPAEEAALEAAAERDRNRKSRHGQRS